MLRPQTMPRTARRVLASPPPGAPTFVASNAVYWTAIASLTQLETIRHPHANRRRHVHVPQIRRRARQREDHERARARTCRRPPRTTRVRVGPVMSIATPRAARVLDASSSRARAFSRAPASTATRTTLAAGARETRRRGVGMSTKRRVVDCGDERWLRAGALQSRYMNGARRCARRTRDLPRVRSSSSSSSLSVARSRSRSLGSPRASDITGAARLANAAVGDVDASDAARDVPIAHRCRTPSSVPYCVAKSTPAAKSDSAALQRQCASNP